MKQDDDLDVLEFDAWFEYHRSVLIDGICQTVRHRNGMPDVGALSGWIGEGLDQLGTDPARLELAHPGLAGHADSDHSEWLELDPSDRVALNAVVGDAAAKSRTLIRAHVDVVPASAVSSDAFQPFVAAGQVLDPALLSTAPSRPMTESSS